MATTPSSERWAGQRGSEAVLGLVGFATSMVSFAFGRFAYGALLPAMRVDLVLSFAGAGALQSVNLGAYLGGSLVAGLAVRRIRAAPLMIWATLGAAGCLAGVALARTSAAAFAAMAMLGFCGGMGWIATATLVIQRAPPARRGWLLGVACAGSGLGLPLVALLIEGLRWQAVPQHWRVVWAVMSIAALVIAGAVFWLTRGDRFQARPEPPVPAGPANPADPAAAADPPAGADRAWSRVTPVRAQWWVDLVTPPVPRLLLVYLLFGVGASVFLTFAIASLTGQAGDSAPLVWAAFGLAGGSGALLVGWLCDRWGARPVLTSSLFACGLATAVPAVSTSLPAMVPAAVAFGVPLIGVGVVITSLLSEALPTAGRASSALAIATLLFSAGQVIGPVVAGILIDRTGSFGLSFGLAAATLLAAASTAAMGGIRGQ